MDGNRCTCRFISCLCVLFLFWCNYRLVHLGRRCRFFGGLFFNWFWCRLCNWNNGCCSRCLLCLTCSSFIRFSQLLLFLIVLFDFLRYFFGVLLRESLVMLFLISIEYFHELIKQMYPISDSSIKPITSNIHALTFEDNVSEECLRGGGNSLARIPFCHLVRLRNIQ